MNPVPGRRTAVRAGAAIGLPVVLLVVLVATSPAEVDAERRAAAVAEHVTAEVATLEQALGALLDAPPRGGGGLPQLATSGPFVRRLEGVALFGPRGERIAWWGTPALEIDDAGEPGPGPRGTRVRHDGIATRLLSTSTPDAAGRTAFASWVLDAEPRRLDFARDLPRRLRRDAHVRIRWSETVVAPEAGATAALRTPDGSPLGTAWVVPTPGAYQRELRLRESIALCAALLVGGLLAVVLPAWRRREIGSAVPLLVLVAGRALLGAARTPFELLPRDVGSARLWGLPSPLGVLSSPGDLLLTAVTVWLAATIVFPARRRVAASPVHRALAALSAVAGAGTLAWLAIRFAEDARVWLLESGPPLPIDAHGALIGSAAFGMLAVCRAATFAAGPDVLGRFAGGRRLVSVVLLVGLATGFVSLMQQRRDALSVDRLRAELAPQILDQRERREAALRSALESVRAHFRDRAADAEPIGTRDTTFAYRFWARSELAASGYKSSLEFYNAEGRRFSQFGFDLPAFDEPPDADPADRPPDAPIEIVEEEYFEDVARPRALLHGSAEVRREGERLGRVVGHVLDEPENMPFQPESRPFLQALGTGFLDTVGVAFREGPQYVLYDSFGTVVRSSLPIPPAWTTGLRDAGRRGARVTTRAADRDWVGYALEEDGRLHLLLLPERTAIERLAAIVRLALAVLLAFAVIELAPRRGRPWRWSELRRGITGSVYRKLLATLLVASILPLLGLAAVMQAVLERNGARELRHGASRHVASAQRVLEDYLTPVEIGERYEVAEINDEILRWLRPVVGQEIHVYENGTLLASSKRELFDGGLLTPALHSEVDAALVGGGRSSALRREPLGDATVSVAYAPVRTDDPHRELIVAVPMVYQEEEIQRSVKRVRDLILLATVALVALLTMVAAGLARSVSRPVRELVRTTHRLAAGEYDTRARAHTEDELAELVRSFNVMAGSLSRQRADLERRRDYVETLLSHATTGVLSTDRAGRIVTANPAAQRLLGTELPADLVEGDEAPTLARVLSTNALLPIADGLAEPGHRDGVPFEVDLEIDDEVRRLRCVRVPLPGDERGPVGALLLLDDVTDLMRSNQLEAWAEMARAIAHEIKNPLTPIQLSADHLARLLRDGGPGPDRGGAIEACLATIGKQVRNLYEIAGEFSTYARIPDLDLKRLPIDEFLREAISPYRVAPPPGIAVEERYETSASARIDARALSRAIVNLVENAFAAMPEGGTLRVSARETEDGIAIEVADDGTGLDDEVRRRLFEPYFSTKSSGTGLGLAIVKRTVEAHQGRIDAVPSEGRGTTFRILLPRSAATPLYSDA